MIPYKVKQLKDKETAVRIGEFLTGPYAFEQTWAPNEKAMVKQAVVDSLSGKNHRYWYVEDAGKIVGAIGVRENKYGSGGYEMDSDYVAVYRDYRNQGIAAELLKEMEQYVKQKNGRYIHVLTCDINSYTPARKFYEKHGYKKVAEIPNYYVPGEGRIDYLKELI
ncbi:MAG: GNAT family N-acetyltransferase [Patescibacteria group bacterium]